MQTSRILFTSLFVCVGLTRASFAQADPAIGSEAPAEPPAEEAEAAEEAPATEAELPVPIDLLGDEHIREEFGINGITTPQIGELFGDLDDLGRIPYDKLRRDFPDRLPADRSLLALSMGGVIADGFLVVQAQAAEALEPVGRAVLDHAKALGAHNRVAEHAKSLLEQSLLGDWEDLKEELGATQYDVEAELILLRDTEIVHLISLGGWVRGLHIASTTAAGEDPFSPEKASALARRDVVAYYTDSLSGLHPRVREKPHIQALTEGLGTLTAILDIPEGRKLTAEEVGEIQAVAEHLLTTISPEEEA